MAGQMYASRSQSSRLASHGQKALKWTTTQGLAYVRRRRPSRPETSGCTPT